MEMTVPIIILALMIVLGLMFYERSRRADFAGQEILRRRIAAGSTPATAEAQPAPETRRPRRPLPYVSALSHRLEQWLAQTGLDMPVQQYIWLTVLSGLAGLLLTALWVNVRIACFYAAGFAALPAAYVAVQRKRRLATFSAQLPYVLDFLRSALRAGHPLSRGLQMSAENALEPMATELRLAIEHMRYGATLPDAVEGIFKRVPDESLGFFVAAVRIQSQVGSSIAEILDRVADAIRARQRLQAQLKTLTAQSRMSGLMVGALPFVLLELLTLIRPEYMGQLFHDRLGFKMLEGAITLDVLALLIIRHMVRVA
jgi:tight adherence protein B